MDSQIQRVTTGLLNEVNDDTIGGTVNGTGTGSRTAGQLGKTIQFTPENLFYNAAVGTLHPGQYQYVQLDAAEPDSPALAAGDLLYWLTGFADSYIVSSTVNANDEAGYVVTPGWTPGNYAYIFVYGQAAEYTPS